MVGGRRLPSPGVYAIHRAKRSSPPTALPKPALALYNAAQVAVNAYVAWEIASALGGRVWGIGIADTPRVRHGVFLHYLCKYLDFADTLVIVLRKKAAQLSFLHLYHHASIVLVWGWVVATWPSGADGGSACYAYGAFVNAVVHVVMYAYYGCTVVELRPPLWLKRSVTGVQLTQFATCVVHAVNQRRSTARASTAPSRCSTTSRCSALPAAAPRKGATAAPTTRRPPGGRADAVRGGGEEGGRCAYCTFHNHRGSC